MARASKDQQAGKTAGQGGEDDAGSPGGEHRALIMQLLSRANRWNASHADLVAEFGKLSGGVDAASSVAIMKWQRGHGLKADGCIGPQTVEAARKASGVEAGSKTELSRGMQGITIRIAKALNRVMQRKGVVFDGRYHEHVLRTPTEQRNALRYVLGSACLVSLGAT